MLFWAIMLICNLTLPAVFALFGFLFRTSRYPTGFAGATLHFVGYRTTRSVKSQAAWVFANEHYCRTCRLLAAPIAAVGLAPMLACIGQSENVVGLVTLGICSVQTLILLASIVPTELALKRVFDKEGNPYVN